MAEERVTQFMVLVEANGSAESVTQAGALVELSPGDTIYVTQFGALVELAYSTERVTQVGVLVELESRSIGRTIAARLTIAWDGSNYVDETAHLISARGESKLTPPGASIVASRGIVDRMSLSLYNPADAETGRRFSPLNAAGPLYAYLADGGSFHRSVRLDIAIDGGAYARVFTGVIKIPTEGVPTTRSAATITIECRSVDEALLQLKVSTLASALKAAIDAQYSESKLIQDVLESPAVGMTASDYTLDAGLFSIPYFWLDDESVLDEIWQLAAAAGGRFYADPDGKLIYENMQHWLFHPAGETFNRSKYDELRIRYDDVDLYNITTVEASPRRLGGSIVLWEPDELIQVPASGTRTLTARLKQPMYALSEIVYQAHTSGGANITANVTVAYVAYAQRLELTLVNSNATYAATIDAMSIRGTPVLGAPTIEEKSESSNAFWTNRIGRARSVRGNVYLQARAQIKALAEFLRDVQELPKLEYTLSNVAGLPARRLGDHVTIDDSLVMSATRTAYLTAISWSYSQQGYRQTLTAIDAANVFKYAGDEYFVIGTDTLGGGKRAFY